MTSEATVSPAPAEPSRPFSVSRLDSWIGRVVILGLVLASAAMAYQRRLATWDDALIYGRVVRNVLDQGTWSYNADRPLNPCTSPLYFALLLGTAAGVGDIPTTIAVLHAVLLSAASIFLFLNLRPWVGWPMAALACFGFLHHPYVTVLNGVETLALLATALASLWAYARQRYVLTAFLLSLTVLSRGDGVLLAVLLLIHYSAVHRRFCGWRIVAAFLLLPVIWSAVHYAHFHTFLPGTLAAKIAQGHAGHWFPFTKGLRILFCKGKPPAIQSAVIIMFSLAAAGWLIAWVRRDFAGALLGSFAMLHFIAYSLLGVAYYHWYYGPEYLAVWYLAAGALAAGSRWAMEQKRPALGTSLAVVGWAAMITVLVILAEPRSAYRFEPSSASQGYFQVADQIRPRLRAGDRVAATEIGALGWALPDQIVEDTVGLTGMVSPRDVAAGRFNTWLARPADMPDYIVAIDRFVHMMLNGDARLSETFKRYYEPVLRIDVHDAAYAGTLYARRAAPAPDSAEVPLLLLLEPGQVTPPDVMLLHVVVDGRIQQGLFEHPTRSIPVKLTISKRYLLFGYGMLPGVYDKSDGARFRLEISAADGRATTVFDKSVRLDVNPAARRWHRAAVDLGAFVGQPVTLTFSTEPLATPSYDQAVWLEPRLADSSEVGSESP